MRCNEIQGRGSTAVPFLDASKQLGIRGFGVRQADKTLTFGRFHEVEKSAAKDLFPPPDFSYNHFTGRRKEVKPLTEGGRCGVRSEVGQDLQLSDSYISGRRHLAAGVTCAARNSRGTGSDGPSGLLSVSVLEERRSRGRGYQDADGAGSLHGGALVLFFNNSFVSDRCGDLRVLTDQISGFIPNRSFCCTDRYQRRALSASRAIICTEPFPFLT